MERLLDQYFTSAISDLIIEKQKEPLLRISITTNFMNTVIFILNKYFGDQYRNDYGSLSSIYLIIINLNMNDYFGYTPCDYNSFENGFNPICNFI